MEYLVKKVCVTNWVYNFEARVCVNSSLFWIYRKSSR